jgi:inosine-uridine nucleoside N-ribohydrolase
MTVFLVFWLDKLQVKIPLYKGIERKNNRSFPISFVSSFFTEVKEEFNYAESKDEAKSLDITNLQIEKDDVALVTGPLTSLLSANYKSFKRIHIMGGNLNVGGNKENGIGEYNLWLDPQSFNILSDYKGVLSICPLDCTNYVPLDDKTIQKITFKSNNPLYSYFIRMINTTVRTINSKLYMWDLVASITLLYGGRYKEIKVKAQDEGFFLQNKKGIKVYLFNKVKYNKVIQKIISAFT